MIEFIPIGKTFKTHGVKGEIEIDIEDIYFDWLLKEKVFFVYINGTPVPFWIKEIRNESRFFVKLEELDSPEKAKSIANKTIYADKEKIPKSILKKLKSNLAVETLDTYSIKDQQSGILSKIISIQEYPSQILAELSINGNKVMIPLHEDFIIEIDDNQKVIHLNLPEGIFDLS